uniref:Uncharacterized protein n=1 Tax=Gracilinema caldarium TaxID=215591 RepID=A0A7C3E6L4_9SPIR
MVRPTIGGFFGDASPNIAGMNLRTVVMDVSEGSVVADQVRRGDVIARIVSDGTSVEAPTATLLIRTLNEAAEAQRINFSQVLQEALRERIR